MKKIAFVATTAVSFNRLYRGQLEYLRDQCELTLITGGDEAQIKKLKDRNVGRVVEIGMVRPPSLLKDIYCTLRLIWFFLFNRFDLVVVTTPKAILLGSIASALTGQKRRVVFFQGRVYENFSGKRRAFYTFLDYIALLLTHEALFVSPSLYAAYKRDISIANKKGLVLGGGSGNGVPIKWFSKDKIPADTLNSIRSKLDIKHNSFVLLSIGRICKDKGFYEIAEITRSLLKKHDHVKLIMLGNVEDEGFFKEFEDLLSSGQVSHVDAVSDIRPYLALADIHLFLTHREGFGNVAIEAASMEVPTLAFDVIGVKDSVAEGISGLKFPLGDNTRVLDAICYFIENPERLDELSKKTRKWVIENYSQEKVWELYKNYYLK